MEPLVVPGTVDSLAAIGRYVRDAAEVAGLERKAAYRLRLAVDELATNVATYAYAGTEPPGDILVRAELTDECLTIIVEDSGPGFDPRTRVQHEEEVLAHPMDQRPVGGVGIYLALAGVDQLDYERVGGRNRSILTTHLRKEGAKPA